MSNIWDAFTEYIINNYSNSIKIIEVGIGNVLEPYNILNNKLRDTEVIGADIHPANENIIKEDITNPSDKLYENVDLIYSIRPPEELQVHIVNLALKYRCDCIIKPFFTEEINVKLQNKLKLINYKKNAFYILKSGDKNTNELGNSRD